MTLQREGRLGFKVTALKHYIYYGAVTDYITRLPLSGHPLFYYTTPTA